MPASETEPKLDPPLWSHPPGFDRVLRKRKASIDYCDGVDLGSFYVDDDDDGG
jgi:hypothetical protein